MRIFSITFLADLLAGMIRGPLVWAAFLVCVLGVAIQARRMMGMIQKQAPQLAFQSVFPGLTTGVPRRERALDWLIFLRVSILGKTPFVAVVSFVFHACLLVAPFFVLAHNVMLDTAFGISLMSLPESVADGMTGIVLVCGGFFCLRRIFVRRVRAISTLSDFIHLAVATGPFLTGFLAYHRIFDYQMMITLHILSAEILLIMIPFSRFSHMIFFFISRLLIVGEHGRKSACRVWRYEQSRSRL